MSIFEVLSMLAPVMCYELNGPSETGYGGLVSYKALTSAPEDDEGVISATFSYGAAETTVLNDGVTDIGPVTGVYDPEWDAFMAGELI
jgi:hypothetical protein